MALSGHSDCRNECPLSGVKRTGFRKNFGSLAIFAEIRRAHIYCYLFFAAADGVGRILPHGSDFFSASGIFLMADW
jgi:hypothetical protein